MNISIVIPTYNRKEKLKACLDSIFKQDYPKESIEIIIVDDGSTDGSGEFVRSLSKEHAYVRYFFQERLGPAVARNVGIRESRAPIIGFTDDDCLLEPGWVKKMVSSHRDAPLATAIGGMTKVNNHNIKAAVSQFLSTGAIKTSVQGKTRTIFLPTCNVSFKKESLDGGFNPRFRLPAGEDLEFFWRLFKSDRIILFNEDIEIEHRCNIDDMSFLRQAYMYGRGNYLVQYLHKDHPLLKEIKVKNHIWFFFSSLLNMIKIPRFSYIMGTKLIRSYCRFTFLEKFQIFIYFGLHKITYLLGTLREHVGVHTQGNRFSFDATYTQDALKPEFIILDITHRCNLACAICDIRKDAPIHEFSTDEVKDIIAQACDWHVAEFVLSGGEAFLRNDIFEILEYIVKKKYHAGILTNGILLTGQYLNKLLPYLSCNSLSLSISLDSLIPQVHDRIRGVGGSFQKTLKGLQRLAELKKQYPSINFNVISIILNDNLEELVALAQEIKSLNANSIQFQPLLANNLIMKHRSQAARFWVPADRLPVLDKMIDDLIKFKDCNQQFVRNSKNNLSQVKEYFRGTLTQSDIRCRNAEKTMLIAYNGTVTTCFDCYGNVRKQRLRQIYVSDAVKKARERVCTCQTPCLLPCFTDY